MQYIHHDQTLHLPTYLHTDSNGDHKRHFNEDYMCIGVDNTDMYVSFVDSQWYDIHDYSCNSHVVFEFTHV